VREVICRLCQRRNHSAGQSAVAKPHRREAHPLLASGVCPLLRHPDYVLQFACNYLRAESIALLRKTCIEIAHQVGHEAHVQNIARLRLGPECGSRKVDWTSVRSLEDLHAAEKPSLNVTLQIFGFASSEPNFDEKTQETLSEYAGLLSRHPEVRVQIEGHGQPGAPEPIASTLARERAEKVAEELQLHHSVSRDRMWVTHCSNRCPRFQDPNRNRRVEMSIIDGLPNRRKKKSRTGRWSFVPWCPRGVCEFSGP